jgi:hypothetical protein
MNKLPLLQNSGLNSSSNKAKQMQEQTKPSKEEGILNGISGYVKDINEMERASPEPESNSEIEETDFTSRDEQEEEEQEWSNNQNLNPEAKQIMQELGLMVQMGLQREEMLTARLNLLENELSQSMGMLSMSGGVNRNTVTNTNELEGVTGLGAGANTDTTTTEASIGAENGANPNIDAGTTVMNADANTAMRRTNCNRNVSNSNVNDRSSNDWSANGNSNNNPSRVNLPLIAPPISSPAVHPQTTTTPPQELSIGGDSHFLDGNPANNMCSAVATFFEAVTKSIGSSSSSSSSSSSALGPTVAAKAPNRIRKIDAQTAASHWTRALRIVSESPEVSHFMRTDQMGASGFLQMTARLLQVADLRIANASKDVSAGLLTMEQSTEIYHCPCGTPPDLIQSEVPTGATLNSLLQLVF